MDPKAQQILDADLNDTSQTLEITWGDQHHSSYPLKYLRAECPCATCRTERQEAKKDTNPFRVLTTGVKPESWQIADLQQVGRYALQFRWGDGHSTGIYSFEYLRTLCPCEVCKAQREPDDKPFVHGIYIPG